MIKFVSIKSGSAGNGYLISDGFTTLMFDAGVPARRLREACQLYQIPLPEFIFISHEHGDHCNQLDVLTRACQPNLSVVATLGTWRRLLRPSCNSLSLKPNMDISIGKFNVTFLPKPHDAIDPVGFRIDHSSGHSFGILTDLGLPDKHLIEGMHGVRILLLESNYDEEMLWNGSYPDHLKRRVASDKGHLSNNQSGDFIRAFLHDHLHTLVLGHLSEENNHPELVIRSLKHLIPSGIHLKIASRYDNCLLFDS